jgi:hypothetical protein
VRGAAPSRGPRQRRRRRATAARRPRGMLGRQPRARPGRVRNCRRRVAPRLAVPPGWRRAPSSAAWTRLPSPRGGWRASPGKCGPWGSGSGVVLVPNLRGGAACLAFAFTWCARSSLLLRAVDVSTSLLASEYSSRSYILPGRCSHPDTCLAAARQVDDDAAPAMATSSLKRATRGGIPWRTCLAFWMLSDPYR